jgi:hypothetical protein
VSEQGGSILGDHTRQRLEPELWTDDRGGFEDVCGGGVQRTEPAPDGLAHAVRKAREQTARRRQRPSRFTQPHDFVDEQGVPAGERVEPIDQPR